MSHRLVKGKRVHMTKGDRIAWDAKKEKEKEQRRAAKELDAKREETGKVGQVESFTKKKTYFKDTEDGEQKTK